MEKKKRFPRKLKKQLIKAFERGTYRGILAGHLKIVKYRLQLGCKIENSENVSSQYVSGQYHPIMTFKNL